MIQIDLFLVNSADDFLVSNQIVQYSNNMWHVLVLMNKIVSV